MGALFGINGFLDLPATIFLCSQSLLLLLCGENLFCFPDLEFHLAPGVLKLELKLGVSIRLCG